MKKVIFISSLFLLLSCTSNTILEEPKDLIPKDTMTLIIQEMFVATSAKFFLNKNKQKNINYMPFVYDQFKIDSSRFKSSNYYYMSKIDDYKKIVDEATENLVKLKAVYSKMKSTKDSLRKDSINKLKELEMKKLKNDSIEKVKRIKKESQDNIKKTNSKDKV